MNTRKTLSAVRFGAVLRLQCLLFGLVLCVWFLRPGWHDGLSREGGVLETAGAALFAAAAISGFVWFACNPRRRFVDLIWPMLAVLGFYDETSFGERVLGQDAAHIYGVKIDAVHDFEDVLKAMLGAHFHGEKILAGVFVALVAVGTLVLTVTVLWKLRAGCARVLRDCVSLRYFLCAIAWMVPAVAIDMNLIPNTPLLICIEELCEVEAALSLLFANLVMPRNTVSGPGPGSGPGKSTTATARPAKQPAVLARH
ncbi:MAG: hypothetical protein VYE77_03075 [Planctomycetota bacterium]|nr:hypothetical protein [Planctomycetota bacterium]